MMQYNRLGLYVQREKKAKRTKAEEQKSTDWVNIVLFGLLLVVVVIFIVT